MFYKWQRIYLKKYIKIFKIVIIKYKILLKNENLKKIIEFKNKSE